MARPRILYSSKAVRVYTPNLGNKDLAGVQSATYGFELARTDVNAFGKLSAHDRLLTTTPTVTAEIQCLAHSGQSIVTKADIMTNSPSQQSSVTIGLNSIDSDDSDFRVMNQINSSTTVYVSPNKVNIMGAFVSSASVEASVGAFALSTVGFEGTGLNNLGLVNPPAAATASPQNRVYVDFPATNYIDDNPNDDPTTTFNENLMDTTFGAVAQSANMTVNITREVLEKFGRLYSDQRLIQFPATASMTLEGLDTNNEIGFAKLTTFSENGIIFPATFVIDCNHYGLQGAGVDSVTFNGGIGDNHTVSLALSSSMGGINDATRNFYWHYTAGINGGQNFGSMRCFGHNLT